MGKEAPLRCRLTEILFQVGLIMNNACKVSKGSVKAFTGFRKITCAGSTYPVLN